MQLKISGGNELIDSYKLLAKGQIQQGFKVADLGCGTSGHFVFPAARLVGEQGMIYAVDILKSVLQNIENRARMESLINVTTVWSDLEKVGAAKIDNSSLDLALFVNTLFQIKDQQTAMREAARLLKTGGYLIIGEWKMGNTPLGPSVEKRLAPDKAKVMAQAAGFGLVEEFEAGPYHYGLVFIKK
ncbi:MAG: methyltransferase domain-containing protein [bacterium]|nr:methyltransferase domain-containing protein [bacterium]